MKAKFDKDALKKHKFWLLLGGFLVLWCVGVAWAFATGGPGKARKDYTDAESKIKGIAGKHVKRPEHQKDWQDFGESFANVKAESWKEAWKLQEVLYSWPGSLQGK